MQGVGYRWSDDWKDFISKMTKGIEGFCEELDFPVKTPVHYQYTAKKYSSIPKCLIWNFFVVMMFFDGSFS